MCSLDSRASTKRGKLLNLFVVERQASTQHCLAHSKRARPGALLGAPQCVNASTLDAGVCVELGGANAQDACVSKYRLAIRFSLVPRSFPVPDLGTICSEEPRDLRAYVLRS